MTSTQKRKASGTSTTKRNTAKTPVSKTKAMAKSNAGGAKITGTPTLATIRKHAKALGYRVILATGQGSGAGPF